MRSARGREVGPQSGPIARCGDPGAKYVSVKPALRTLSFYSQCARRDPRDTSSALAVMPWAQTSAGVEEWVPDPTGSDPQVATPAIDAPARKLSLAEQIAATRAKQASAKAEASEPTTEPAKPRKLSLAEQIAATRARAAGGAAPAVAVATREQLTAKMEAAAAKSEAEAAARAERFRVKEEATAAADAVEAMRESEAAREADKLAAVEADRVAQAEMEAACCTARGCNPMYPGCNPM